MPAIDELLKIAALGRSGQPEEIASVVNFLCSEEASFVTGISSFQATTPPASAGNPLVLGPAIQRWGQKRTVVFSGDLNTVHGPVKTQFGYHLLEITQRSE